MFDKFSAFCSKYSGSPYAFVGAVFIIVGWAFSGPVFHFSDTWQLVINTGTTIITFLMVFLIQNAQNRDMKALHVKLDALIVAIENVRNDYAGVQERSTEELNELDEELRRKLKNQN